MLIEFAGLPGSGKTTLLKRLRRELEKRDIAVTDANTIAEKRTDDKNAPRFVRNKPHRNLLFRLTRFSAKNPEFFSKAEQSFEDATIKKFLFFLFGAHFQMARDLQRDGEVVFMDEGFLNHCVAIYPGKSQRSDFLDLMNTAPKSDVLIYFDIPAEVAFDRAVQRRGEDGKAREQVIEKFGNLDAFEERRGTFMAALDIYKHQDATVLLVGPEESLDQAATRLADRLIALNG
ncbi:AAA family ATPase [Roseovarius sp. MMSF_3281]|uniref:AAA family ATPase n=1 Tax=Roseovarius sp. MMSF_3281 TaxID=3046694 RepID=UPI00273E5718|nr:AAA family ATPase [Roseovarius sp. MMSF_3281]